MLGKFWEGLGEKLAERWVTTFLGPAFAFWVGGLLAWTFRFNWITLEQWFTKFSETEQIAILVAGLLTIIVSAAAVQLLSLPILRFLEGYWPWWLRWVRQPLVWWQNYKIDRTEQKWQQLASKDFNQLTLPEREQYITFDHQLRLAPTNRDERMPTKLGNILRAAEGRPGAKYGLDAIICWPRLWLLLPNDVKTELTNARSTLDTAICITMWGLLFLLWSVWAWWAIPAGILVAIFAYRWALRAAEVYGDLLEAAFDLYRMNLYEALHWPLPTWIDCEQAQGKQVTEYLFRGIIQTPLTFTHFRENKKMRKIT